MIHHYVFCLLLGALGADSENATEAGKLIAPHPTLLNIGFEWPIRGDANRSAIVTVQFRRVGENSGKVCRRHLSDHVGLAR